MSAEDRIATLTEKVRDIFPHNGSDSAVHDYRLDFSGLDTVYDSTQGIVMQERATYPVIDSIRSAVSSIREFNSNHPEVTKAGIIVTAAIATGVIINEVLQTRDTPEPSSV